ncbi:MAG: hypothetical protein BWX88_02669 [Planctomycetes bacterium ADurb.Bin126]|nr:MAG: hypothetical protein BWX88_02669 [Planctomycetes bacterium ADurb.Bin126]HOD79980.1 hypothetical protein [Phycisphaerae bacterium]HQL74037.1 hypothetical protein [Phycisphaerae bacterium]
MIRKRKPTVVAARMYMEFLRMSARDQGLTLAALASVHLEKLESDKATIGITDNAGGPLVGCIVLARGAEAEPLAEAN